MMESLVQLGVAVELWYDSGAAAPELRDAADIRHELTLEDWHAFTTNHFRDRHPLPKTRIGPSKPGFSAGLLQLGTASEGSIRLWRVEGNRFTLELEQREGFSLFATHANPDWLANQYLPYMRPGAELTQVG